jgi:Flp pilus assembly secretin CpaC
MKPPFAIALILMSFWNATPAFSQGDEQGEYTAPELTEIDGLYDLRQVQINVLIGEFGERGIVDVGNNLDYTRFIRGSEQGGAVERVRTNVFESQNQEFTVTLPAPDSNPAPDNLRPDQAGALDDGIQTQSGAGVAYSIVDSGHGTLDGVFRGSDQASDVDLYSKPELLVVNNRKATIHAGGDVPYQSINYDNRGQAFLNVSWQPTGVNMQIQPTIGANDLINVHLEKLEVSELTRIENVRGVDLPVFSTRKQNGHVLVPNGKSLVIGGLSSRTDRQTERRVPVLGRIPLLGMAFRGRQSETTTRTLFIFVTPTIVDLRELKPSAVNALDFWHRGEWKNRDRIERELDAMSQDL